MAAKAKTSASASRGKSQPKAAAKPKAAAAEKPTAKSAMKKAAAKKKPGAVGAPPAEYKKGDILQEQPVDAGSGYRNYKDLTFEGKAQPQTSGKNVDGKKANPEGTIFNAPDTDLSAADKAALAEDGVSGDMVVFPWGCVVEPMKQSGTPVTGNGSGYASHLITMASSRNKKIGKDKYCNPDTISDEEFFARIDAAHKAYGIRLARVVVRRERPKSKCKKAGAWVIHEHLHAATDAGDANSRYRWKRISDWLRGQYLMFVNFAYVRFPAAAESIEEMCHNAVMAPKEEAMTPLEFRQIVQDLEIKDVRQLHRATVDNHRLDIYVNDQKKSPAAKLKAALESIQFRHFKESSLLRELLQARDKLPCCCSGAVLVALKEWSAGVEWPGTKLHGEQIKATELSAGYVLLRWAKMGRVGGNTLALCGPTGTGKSWIVALMRACLNRQYYEIPKPAGSYPFESLGHFFPEKYAFLLDECSIEKVIAWLGMMGWWKTFLDVQTVRELGIALPSNQTFGRVVFTVPAPVVYTATNPIRLRVGQSGYQDFEAVKSENLQQARRETLGRCEVCVDRGIDHRLPDCGHCFSKYLHLCQQHYQVLAKENMPSPVKKARQSM
eukprot:g19510.t1